MPRLAVEAPIFIVGARRSGTTLLRSLLSAHSRIAISPETHLMEWAARHSDLEAEAPEDFAAFWESYASSTRFKDLGVDEGYCRDLISRQGQPTYRSIFDAMLLAYRERVNKPRAGEKTPGHVRHVPRLLRWYPDASILVLRRDPRAVAASELRTPWIERRLTPTSLRHGLLVGSRLHQVAIHSSNWSDLYERVVPSWIDDRRVYAVSYETLVDDPENELRRLCAFLVETYESAMLSGRTDGAVPAPAATDALSADRWRQWRRAHHQRSLSAVSTDSVDRWRQELNRWEVSVVEAKCAEGMRKAGYAPAAPWMARLVMRWSMLLLFAGERVESHARRISKNMLRPIRKAMRT